MKRIEELGISPWPWSAEIGGSMIYGARCNEIAQSFTSGFDKTIMSAAPVLYKTEYDLVDVIERLMNGWAGTCDTPTQDEVIAALEAAKNALAKAAGEEAANGK